jgi:rRNA biogenesis protein RRP5
MAPIKRKGNTAEESSARNPQKRVRVGAEEHKTDGKSSTAGSAPKASELTVLRDDEPSFPRGGGSVLTPLERKQIHIKATKDVLFEQNSGTKKPSKDEDEAFQEDTDMEDADEDASTPAKKSQKRKGKGKKDAKQDKREKKGVRIEGLSFKVRLFSRREVLSTAC